MPNCRKPTVRLTVPHYCPKPTVRLTVPHYCPKAMVLWLGLFACLPFVGCGRGSDGAGRPDGRRQRIGPDAAPAAKAPADSPSPRNPPIRPPPSGGADRDLAGQRHRPTRW